MRFEAVSSVAGRDALNLKFITLLALIFSACSSHLFIQHGPAVIINGVPFYPQEDYQCGPASLAGVLNYYGFYASPEEIAAEIYSRSARGTLNLDMKFYAVRKGLRAEIYKGSLNDLRERIKAGYPLIVLVDHGYGPFQVNHFMVIVGYNDSGIFANSGKEERKYIPYKEFLRVWEKTGKWTLLINR